MRRILALAIVALAAWIFFLPRPTRAVAYYVQSTVSTQPWGTATSCVNVYGSNVAKGDLLVEAGTVALQTNATTISDTQGNTWTKLYNQITSITPSQEIVMWDAVAKASAADTVTLGTASANIGCIASEYTGFTGYAVDQLASQNSQSGPPSCSSPAVTTTSAPEIAVGYTNNGDAAPSSTSLLSPVNNRQNLVDSGTSRTFAVLGDEYLTGIQVGYHTNPALCAGGGSAGAIVTFKESTPTRVPHHAHMY